MTVLTDRETAFLASIRRIADEVAGPNSADVDRNARFPSETIEALRAEQLLSAFIPIEYGGGGVSFESVALACFELGKRCGASAMVFAQQRLKFDQCRTLLRNHQQAGRVPVQPMHQFQRIPGTQGAQGFDRTPGNPAAHQLVD